jgi:hypothetical protein
MKTPAITATTDSLTLLDPYVPNPCINERWNARPIRGPRRQFSAAQLWRVHLLTLLTPIASIVSRTHVKKYREMEFRKPAATRRRRALQD